MREQSAGQAEIDFTRMDRQIALGAKKEKEKELSRKKRMKKLNARVRRCDRAVSRALRSYFHADKQWSLAMEKRDRENLRGRVFTPILLNVEEATLAGRLKAAARKF